LSLGAFAWLANAFIEHTLKTRSVSKVNFFIGLAIRNPAN
jgi:hypothetical protein